MNKIDKNTAKNMRTFQFKQVYFEILRGRSYEGWNFNSGNYLFATDTK